VDPSTLLLEKLGISVLLGLLVGLQREHATHGMAGLRTFPLITVLGTVAATLGVSFGGWIVAAGMLGLVGVLFFPNLVRLQSKDPDPGITTNVAVLLMYCVGALLAIDKMMPVGIAVGGGVAVLLQFKPELHGLAAKLGDADLRAIMQFVLIACIILPVLPDRTYGPLGVFDPFATWLLVVLIVGMNLGGYILQKFCGAGAGTLLAGILGGLISSTAATVSYSRVVRQGSAHVRVAAVVIMIATTVSFVRVLTLIAVVSAEFFLQAFAPIAVLTLVTLFPLLVIWRRARHEPPAVPNPQNPAQLRPAIFFAGMYVVVLFALAATKQYVGGHAVYGVAALSGLTDLDAVTLSTARLCSAHAVVAAQGWRMVVLASLANLSFKAGVVAVLAGGRLFRSILALFAAPLAVGVLIIVFWPA
jgi:uncharacterized membrane protein (DUF4010 family)